jgi:hypothetical protein
MRGIPPYARVRGRGACLLSTMPNEFWNHRLPWPRYPRPSSWSLGLFLRRSIPRATYRRLPGRCVWNVVGHLCSLSLLVPELGIWWLLIRKHTLGALSFHWSVARPEPPTPSSSSETAWVETSRGPNSSPSRKATVGDISSAPGSSDVMVLANKELGLPIDWG